jgi:hypothetical protein
VRASTGEWVSVGAMDYGGTFGGFLLRTSPNLAVNARLSAFIPAIDPAFAARIARG